MAQRDDCLFRPPTLDFTDRSPKHQTRKSCLHHTRPYYMKQCPRMETKVPYLYAEDLRTEASAHQNIQPQGIFACKRETYDNEVMTMSRIRTKSRERPQIIFPNLLRLLLGTFIFILELSALFRKVATFEHPNTFVKTLLPRFKRTTIMLLL